MKTGLYLVLGIALLAPVARAEERPYIDVQVKNVSSFNRGLVEVKDEVCLGTLSEECVLAEHVLDSAECKKDKHLEACREARDLVDRGACVRGSVYRGWLEPGESVALKVCADANGYAALSARIGGNTWKGYSWISAGGTVEVR